MTILSAPAARTVLALAAVGARGELGDAARLPARAVLRCFVVDADQREAAAVAGGQLRLDVGPRVYPTLPPLRRSRRRPADPAER